MGVETKSACATQKETAMSRIHESPQGELVTSSSTSDADLENRVRVFLAGLKIPGLRGVTVGVEGGVARVGGAVQTFYEKQLVTHCCKRVAGVVGVVNNVRVVQSTLIHRQPERKRSVPR
jgi:osmotically-inducible protein OsmY